MVWRFDAELPGPVHVDEQAIRLATNQVLSMTSAIPIAT